MAVALGQEYLETPAIGHCIFVCYDKLQFCQKIFIFFCQRNFMYIILKLFRSNVRIKTVC